ncbi:unnamed protein product [Staurois parvus]|uniref:Uncharacterized protein n=1 Tax=Staurois parvus TaxID=386267 RepID=A0ABN9DZI6_9NEOB|nr:unnamed protein product [Staurois parvus]
MPISATYQCPSVHLISAHHYSLISVHHSGAHQCCLSVPISAAALSVPPRQFPPVQPISVASSTQISVRENLPVLQNFII